MWFLRRLRSWPVAEERLEPTAMTRGGLLLWVVAVAGVARWAAVSGGEQPGFHLVVNPKYAQDGSSNNTALSAPVDISRIRNNRGFGLGPGDADFDGRGSAYRRSSCRGRTSGSAARASCSRSTGRRRPRARARATTATTWLRRGRFCRRRRATSSASGTRRCACWRRARRPWRRGR